MQATTNGGRRCNISPRPGEATVFLLRTTPKCSSETKWAPDRRVNSTGNPESFNSTFSPTKITPHCLRLPLDPGTQPRRRNTPDKQTDNRVTERHSLPHTTNATWNASTRRRKMGMRFRADRPTLHNLGREETGREGKTTTPGLGGGAPVRSLAGHSPALNSPTAVTRWRGRDGRAFVPGLAQGRRRNLGSGSGDQGTSSSACASSENFVCKMMP